MNKSKAIGTRGETAVVNALLRHGFPHADRKVLKGRDDECDIWLLPGLVCQVKAGHSAERASLEQVTAWLDATDLQRDNARATLGFLVTKRAGVSEHRAEHWWAWLWFNDLKPGADLADDFPVRMTLRDATNVLRRMGYGSPLEVLL